MTSIDKNKQLKHANEPVEQVQKLSLSEIKRFIEEVKLEGSKIVWPEKKVTLNLTLVVIAFATMVSIYLGTIDLLLGKLISFILD